MNNVCTGLNIDCVNIILFVNIKGRQLNWVYYYWIKMLHSVSKMSPLTFNNRQNGSSVCYVLSCVLLDVIAHIFMDCTTTDDVWWAWLEQWIEVPEYSIVAVKSFKSRDGGNYWKLGEPLVPSWIVYYSYENKMESLKIQEKLYAWLTVLKILPFPLLPYPLG